MHLANKSSLLQLEKLVLFYGMERPNKDGLLNSFLVGVLLLFRNLISQQTISLVGSCIHVPSVFFFSSSLSYFPVPLILQDFSQSLCVCALCQIAVWLLEADTAAWLLAKLGAEYQCSGTVTAGNICPFKMERGIECNIEGEGKEGWR